MEDVKQKKLKVDPEKFEVIAKELGIAATEQAGFRRFEGPKGRRLYVAKAKAVGRVDVSGFELPSPTPGVIDLKGESFGAVKQQLDFSGAVDEATVLSAFRAGCELMKTLGPAEKVKKEFKAKPIPASVNAPAGSPVLAGNPAHLLPIFKLTADQKAARRQLIEDAARRMGVSVSPKAIEALA